MTTNYPEGSSTAGTPDRSGDDGAQQTSPAPHGPDSPGYRQPGEPAFGEPGPGEAGPGEAGATAGAPYGEGAVPPPPASTGQTWQDPQAGYGGHPGYGAQGEAPVSGGYDAGYQSQPGGHAQGQPGGAPSSGSFQQDPYGTGAPYAGEPGAYGHPGAAPGYGAGQPGAYGQPGAAPGYGQPGAAPGYGPGQPGYGQQGHQQHGPQVLSDSDQRLWATLTHLSALIFPLLGPLVAWLVLRERGAFVEDQTKEALNFNITMTLTGVVITIVSVITLGIGAILYLYYVAALIFIILAAVAANRGERYRYPLTIRLVN